MKLVLATHNHDKVKEIKALLSDTVFDVLILDDFPEISEIEEDGETLRQNAYKKAKTVFDNTGLLSLADDTGLEVDALDGRPGVYSSRFSGENASYEDNVNKLLSMMEEVPDPERNAQFRCVISIVGSDIKKFAEGICPGKIIRDKRGDRGFGYDPVFYVPGYKKTLAEMDLELKNIISHRGIALKKAIQILTQVVKT
ncbi:XTP/dITP diphosphatase [candidate division KSB1 bacterium]|nr:XTP/dITP diphosphatase [candidate division KSB1 bacterium]